MKERDYTFDNIKALLMFLVVEVHLIAAVGRVTDYTTDSIDLFILFACAFHMPLFMFISGYFSKKLEKCQAKAENMLVAYFLVQIALAVYYITILRMPRDIIDIIAPGFSMWYLAVMIIMKWLQPSIVKIPHLLWWLLLLNIVSCVAEPAGYAEKTIVKVCGFAFFYMLGYYTSKEQIDKLRKLPKILPVGVLVGSCALLFALTRGIKPQIISLSVLRNLSLHNKYLADIGIGPAGLLWAVFVLVIALLMSASIIAITPNKKYFFSYIGANTLPIYVAQVFFYKIYKEVCRTAFLTANPMIAYAITIALSIFCVAFFGSDFFANKFNSLVSKVEKKVFSKKLSC